MTTQEDFSTEFEVVEKRAPLEARIKAEEKPRVAFEEEVKKVKAEEAAPSPAVSEATLQANKWIISTCVKALGNTAYAFTQVEEAKCDDIADPLGEVWAPFLPMLPPITQAIIVTITLVGPKIGIVIYKMRKKRETPEVPPVPGLA
uniref:Uncharacterized protein n=1 Tax=viral metagenome TaxID=1070528 RepID=A0A6H2A1M6_9ZZZZ